MLDPARSIALAERVAEIARQLGFESALIGAGALAVHRYTRGTEDIDLAGVHDPGVELAALARELRERALRATLRLPDDQDPLGGVITIHPARDDHGGSDDRVEVVNFRNPGDPAGNPGPGALTRARPLPESALRCVTVEDLVALKLHAGGLADRSRRHRRVAGAQSRRRSGATARHRIAIRCNGHPRRIDGPGRSAPRDAAIARRGRGVATRGPLQADRVQGVQACREIEVLAAHAPLPKGRGLATAHRGRRRAQCPPPESTALSSAISLFAASWPSAYSMLQLSA